MKVKGSAGSLCDVVCCMCSEVWPDRREFGAEGMSLQDEFMALREICFTELPSSSLLPLLLYSH